MPPTPAPPLAMNRRQTAAAKLRVYRCLLLGRPSTPVIWRQDAIGGRRPLIKRKELISSMSKSQRYRYRTGWHLSPQHGPSRAPVATHHTHSRDETIGIKIRHESTQSCVTNLPIDLLVRLKTAIFTCGYSHLRRSPRFIASSQSRWSVRF